MHLELIAEGHDPCIECEFVSLLEGAEDFCLASEETRRDREDQVRVEDRLRGLHLDQDVHSMITLNEWQLRASALFGLRVVAPPGHLIILVLLIKHVPRVHIVLHYNLTSAVLQEVFPGGRDESRFFWGFKGRHWCENAGSHVHVVQTED